MLARLDLGGVLGWSLCVACAPVATAAPLAQWSPPRLLAGCAQASSPAPPLVVFPSSQPRVRSGPGALLWTGLGGCGGALAGTEGGGSGAAAGAGEREALAAPLGPNGLPGRGRALNTAGPAGAGPVEIAMGAGTALGQVIVMGSGTRGAAAGRDTAATEPKGAAAGGRLTEGRLPSAFSRPLALGGPAAPDAVTSGYLGDTAIASTIWVRGAGPAVGGVTRAGARPARRGAWAIAVRVQRHYSLAPSAARLLAAGVSRPSALAVAMDYRGDVLVTWVAAGRSIEAREIDAGVAVGPVERVGVGVGVTEPRALISDDGHAIVVWREQALARRGAGRTSIEVSISGPGMVFGRARSVERFTDLPGLAPASGSLRLTRLSSEAVMMAWTGMRAGRYVVRASPVSLRRGVWAPVTISPRGRQALLAALVAGPRAEALALWTTAPRLRDGRLDRRRRAIFAAWGHYGGHGEARFAVPEAVAPAGPNGIPGVAFDPQSDMALAAWATGARTPRIVYARRAAGPPAGSAVALEVGRARPAVPARAAAGARTARPTSGAPRGVWLAALGLALVAAAAAVLQLSGRGGGSGRRGPARWHGRTRVPRA
jgi:hypothetical protein